MEKVSILVYKYNYDTYRDVDGQVRGSKTYQTVFQMAKEKSANRILKKQPENTDLKNK